MNDITHPFGYYKFKGYKKTLFNVAQSLPKNKLLFKFSLVLRKLALQNKVRIVDAEILGIKARFYPLDNVGDRFALFIPKYYEADEFELMASTLKKDSTFIDIGANTGVYSLMAAKNISKDGNIVAFEPNPVMAQRVELNAEFSGAKDKIKVLEIGVANEEKEFSLGLQDANLGGASIVKEFDQGSIKVKCRPLLSVVEELDIKKIDLLKIDIEEAEPLAMNPFFENAPRELFPKMVFIESDKNIPFKELGYRFVKRTRAHNSIYELID